jgi:membrane-bound ClpP family serine protease
VTKAAFRAGDTGSVFVQGEWWNARIPSGEVAANVPVQVLGRERMTLIVIPISDPYSVASAEPSAAGAQLTQTEETQ